MKIKDELMEKVELRRQLRNRLLSMPAAEQKAKSKKACQNLISTEEFQHASIVMLFLSLPHEVDTSDAILHAWQLGKTVAVPKISWQQRHMIPVQITSLETGFSTSSWGLRNPTGGADSFRRNRSGGRPGPRVRPPRESIGPGRLVL